MEYIKLKYKDGLVKRKSVMRMGGFELEAPVKYDNGETVIRKGQVAKDFSLEIPPDGFCKIPDTAHNREVLKFQCFDTEGVLHGEKVKNLAAFELLSNIDLKDEAPTNAERLYTADEVKEMMDRLKPKAKLPKVKVKKTKLGSENVDNLVPDVIES